MVVWILVRNLSDEFKNLSELIIYPEAFSILHQLSHYGERRRSFKFEQTRAFTALRKTEVVAIRTIFATGCGFVITHRSRR